jgi:2-keto-4-pentenoate hydratase/2-oxohepta-3-ene-1,7-dioic acid hydratase in catechol pathway
MRLATTLGSWLLGFLCACSGAPLDEDVAPPPTENGSPKPAPTTTPATSEALKLARIAVGAAVHTIAITKDDGDDLEGVDVSAALGDDARYPLDLVSKHGFAKLAELAASGTRVAVDRRALLAPIAEGTAQVNAAENYADHQAETGAVDTKPFLFPKIAAPTGCDVSVERKTGDLLDYETELCVAFDRDIASEADLKNATIGYVLCNDLSERAIQILNLDPDNQASGRGFTDAKSRPGFLPLGPYVVVPKDANAFLPKITLRLTVNGEQRQEDAPKNMVWDVARLVREALAAGSDPRFVLDGKPLALLPDGKIVKGTLLVSGTPGGVTLKAPTQVYKITKAALYVASGAFFSGQTVEQFVQAQYVADLRASKTFLKPGDVIEAEGTLLGRQRITVTGGSD